MPVDMSQIPPQALQAVAAQQQGAAGGTDASAVLQQLAQDPQALAAALQQFGINVTPEQLMMVAEEWIDSAADKSTGQKGPQVGVPGARVDNSEEIDEGDEVTEADEAPPTPMPSVRRGAGPPMPPAGGGGGLPPGMTMEDIVGMSMGAEGLPPRGAPKKNARPPAR